MHRLASLTILALLAPAVAYDVHLEGSVYDQSGKGILGARVGLAGSGLSTTSGPDGSWSLVARIEQDPSPSLDTLLIGRDDGSAPVVRKPVTTFERTGIMLVVDAKQFAVEAPPRVARVEPPPAMVAPVQTPPPVAPPVVPVQPPEVATPRKERSPIAGKALLHWEHPLPPGAFSAKGEFHEETWTGTYEDGPILFGEPSAQDYVLDLRVGVWEMREDAWTEIGINGVFAVRDPDAGDEVGFAPPELWARIGLTSWFGARLGVFAPWGSSGIGGTEQSWTWGGGLFLSPSWEYLQLDASASFHPGPGLLAARVEPLVPVGSHFGIRTAVDYRRVFHDSKPAWYGPGFYALDEGKDTRSLLTVEPGVRARLGRNLGFDVGTPITLSGRLTVAMWTVRAGVRGAFGL